MKNLKCFQQGMFGIRKNCIKEKCALWLMMYSTDKDGKSIETPACTHKANAIAQLDIAGAINSLRK